MRYIKYTTDYVLKSKFGRWTPIKEMERNSSGNRMFLCRCDCGNEGSVTLNSLTGGKSSQCKICAQSLTTQKINIYHSQKLEGKIFANLKAVKKLKSGNRKDAIWICKCLLCGKECEYRSGVFSLSTVSHVACPGCESRMTPEVRRGYLPVLFAYKQAKAAARTRKIEFDMSIEQYDLLTTRACVYCGYSEGRLGIDRINSCDGYAIKNVYPCCSICNMMKNNLSERDFMEHIKRIYLYSVPR